MLSKVNMKISKTSIFFLLIAISLSSCKTKEIVSIKTIKEIDSTENIQLKQTLFKMESVNKNLTIQLNRIKQENERLQANTDITIKEYDIDKPNAPLRKEVIYKHTETSQRERKESESTITLLNAKLNKYKSENAELYKQIDLLKKENTDSKVLKEIKPKLQWWWLMIGFIVGLVFFYYLNSIIKK